MTEHNLFYYPYASFTDAQLPLLKVAAMYFDKLAILDPVGASWDTIGADHLARDALRLLKSAGILEVVTPATVLGEYEAPMAAAIRGDMADRQFLDLCESQSRATGRQRWTLSLAKVPQDVLAKKKPQDVEADLKMRHLMGAFAQDVASKTAYAANDYIEHLEALSSLPGNDQPIPSGLMARASEYREYAKEGKAYDEYREGYGVDVEYRYADFPLALGEAIMMNHALFAGLLHTNATPITDDPFHNKALSLKLRRVLQDPAVQEAQGDRARQLKIDLLAVAALTDSQLSLPVLSPELPLEAVLEYRDKHTDALGRAREKLGWMARGIEHEPWSREFASELEHKTIPDIAKELDEAGRARDAWLQSQRGRKALSATGIAVGSAAALLSVFAAPLAPVALATAGLSFASGTVIPGAEWLLDWRNGKKSAQENGLHYLLEI